MIPVILHHMWSFQIWKWKIPFARNAESRIAREGQIFRKSTQAKFDANGYLDVIHVRNLGAEVV